MNDDDDDDVDDDDDDIIIDNGDDDHKHDSDASSDANHNIGMISQVRTRAQRLRKDQTPTSFMDEAYETQTTAEFNRDIAKSLRNSLSEI